MLTKICLLLWKNFLLLRHHWFISICLISTPILMAGALAYRKSISQIPNGGGGSTGDTWFPEFNEADIMRPLSSKLDDGIYGGTNFIGYSPKSALGERIVWELARRIDLIRLPEGNSTRKFNVTGFSSESEMEVFNSLNMLKQYYTNQEGSHLPANSDTKYRILFCLVFDGLSGDQLRSNVSYKVRMNGLYINTRTLMDTDLPPGPSRSGVITYIHSAFLGIQYLLDRILIEEVTHKPPNHTISMQAFPYPPYKGVDLPLYYILLPGWLVCGFVFLFPIVASVVGAEKHSGMKELLKMSGISGWVHWIGCMLCSLLNQTVTVTFVVVLLFAPLNSEVGALFQYSDPTLVWFVLMVYVAWATSFGLLMSSCFEKSTLSLFFGTIIWYLSPYWLGLAMLDLYGKNFSLGVKLLFCLFPNVPIILGMRIISDFEMSGVGAHWWNLQQIPPGSNNVATLGSVLLMFLVSTCQNIMLCQYFDNILPTKYGVRKPFYYIFQPSEWGLDWWMRYGVTRNGINIERGGNSNPAFEAIPVGVKAGVQIDEIRKEFGNGKVALNNVSLDMLKGQIFCLLGQNGAGKTTLMNIVAGLLTPTSGSVVIDGHDIQLGLDKIRKTLGFCPQHNILFHMMTVMEHLEFFGMLKGLPNKTATAAANELIIQLQLEDKRNVLSVNLSGGQKRKLSLGCALIGGSRIVFLDEPTSGMDPEARRAIWDLLLELRRERTIILTTHFMEEADVLGDRIAIMAAGQVQCCGSPNFLKRYYGAGYILNMSVILGADRDTILKTVCKHFSNAHFNANGNNTLTELGIVLPSASDTTSKFPEMFKELAQEQDKLGVYDIGVGWSTMDEIFIRVAQLSINDVDISENFSRNGLSQPIRRESQMPKKLSGLKLVWSQFIALIKKRLLYILRSKLLILVQLIIPVLLALAAVAFGHILVHENSPYQPAIKFDLSSYKHPVTLFASEDEEVFPIYSDVVGPSARVVGDRFDGNVSLGLLDAAGEDLKNYRENYIVGAEINEWNMKAMYSTLAQHSAPLSMNILANTLLRLAAPERGSYKIETGFHPFRDDVYEMVKQTSRSSSSDSVFGIIFAMLISVGLGLLSGSFVVGPAEERLSKAKQLQMMTGVSPLLYWSSYLLCDIWLALISFGAMTSCLYLFASEQMLIGYEEAGIFFLLLTLYAMASIPMSYLFSKFVPGVVGGFVVITIINLFTGVGAGTASVVLETNLNFNPESLLSNVMNIIRKPFPAFGVTRAIIEFVGKTSYNGFCQTIPKSALTVACDPNLAVDRLPFQISRQCCENCADFGECFQPASYLQWMTSIRKQNSSGFPVTYQVPGLGQDAFWLFVMAVASMLLLMILEYGVFARIRNSLNQSISFYKSAIEGTDHVRGDNEQVHMPLASNEGVNQPETVKDALVVNSLCKSFGSFPAVSELSFKVHQGECFGLLGVNGAGKTTTFKMLTGDETPDSGDAVMDNISLGRERRQLLSRLGYCPQFDGLINILSGKEMICLFARLRGIRGNRVEDEANKWLAKVGLTASANVQCHKYSGGMKRRLSTAIAFTGDPPVVLLDEPTSGVDPVARRQFWKIITSITNSNSGQAIILTSHSMEECEALCSRLGIMANGKLQCLGGVQSVKNKFGQGYNLTVKLQKVHHEPTDSVIKQIADRIYAEYESCSLKEHYQGTMKFQIRSKSYTWEDLYRRMEGIKHEFQDVIEEYAITESTLEEVFLSFARRQVQKENHLISNPSISHFPHDAPRGKFWV